ncbi:MAG: type I phosphomannose isomerase catalytic subunit [Mycoplasma sp.]
MTNIIFLKPYLEEKVWGGQKLKNFGYLFNNELMGEAWLISALKDKSSIITNPELNNQTLNEFYLNNPSFFNFFNGDYPLLTKIIEANDDLSVQVHPNNEYAKKRHNKLGKTECWYILDAEPGASIVYGLKESNREIIAEAINNGNLEEYLNIIDVKKGDMIYIPAGLVHATKGKILFYELQQSSDLTYRLYDYNRLDNGKLRELHIEDSLNVINFEQNIASVRNNEYLVETDLFKLKEVTLTEETYTFDFPLSNWVEVTVIEGSATIEGKVVKKGDAFIIKHNYSTIISGTCKLFIGLPN